MEASALPLWVEQVKFLASVGGVLWIVFSGYTFFKNSITEMQTGVKELKSEVNSQTETVNATLSNQTAAVVKATDANTKELVELRSDMRMMLQSMIAPPFRSMGARAARRKK